MWPTESLWARANYVPNCAETGMHKFGALHFLPANKSVMIQVCKRCPARRITQYNVTDGKMIETDLEIEHVK